MSTNSAKTNDRKFRRRMGTLAKGELSPRQERRLNKLARRRRILKDRHGL